MILIFGGAYQGKLSFALEHFGLSESDVCFLDQQDDIDFSKKIINGIEHFVDSSLDKGENPIKYIEDNMNRFKNKIIICTDISCGVVPLEPQHRLIRDNTGKIMQILSRNSEEVFRIFCGLSERLK